MNNFTTMLQEENTKAKTFTENGAVAYESSGKYLLDFNFKLSQYRNITTEQIKNDFSKVYFEDPLIATKFIFYVGDVRGGLGERKVFNACMEWLADNKPEIAKTMLSLIPEYTRWDNLIKLTTNKNIGDWAFDIVKCQLYSDMDRAISGEPISLCAKWMPSINTSSKETVRLAYYLCGKLEITPREYRKMLSTLRRYLDVVEVKTSSNDWGSILYETVPSKANIKYNHAFMKHDEERRFKYLQSVQKGEAKINASVAQPHEIINSYLKNNNVYYCDVDVEDYDIALEEMWKNLPDISVENSLVVRDGSGSMTCRIGNGKGTCLDVATALAIYCSEHNSKEWKDKFITFSRTPKFVDLSNCNTLRDKIIRCYAENEISNTDIAATMRLILDTAIKNDCRQEDMPKNIIIISDMQFDSYGSYSPFNWDKTLFEKIAEEYYEYGYLLPKICFWNVSSRSFNTIPMQNNELGLVLCSGFSTTNIKMFMSGEINPYKVLLEQINNDRYNVIEERYNGVVKR